MWTAVRVGAFISVDSQPKQKICRTHTNLAQHPHKDKGAGNASGHQSPAESVPARPVHWEVSQSGNRVTDPNVDQKQVISHIYISLHEQIEERMNKVFLGANAQARGG